jgi:RHS repeat-associated protein
LQHNIIRVTAADGRTTTELQYGADPGSDDFGRVVSQQFGGYGATFAATRLQYVPRVPDAINAPAVQVQYVDPGVLRIYTFNYRGDLLDERFRLIYDGSYRLIARVYRYDDQGNLIQRREPNGLGMFYTYDKDNVDPRARGNVLKLELVAPPTTPQPSRIIQVLTYEPTFHRLKTIRDEQGRVTTWVYDYEALVGTKGDVVRIEHPKATLADGTIQARVEQFTYNAFGQLTEQLTGAGHRHVFAYGAAGYANGYLTSVTWDAGGAAESQSIQYDAQGHRTAFVDGLGNRTESDFDSLDRLIAVRLPAIAGAVDVIRFRYTPDGRVAREEWPLGSYDDALIADPFLASEYTYDIFGNVTSAVHGANTGAPISYQYVSNPDGKLLLMTDPLGRVTKFGYDERGLVLTRTEAVGTAVEATWTFAYDRNGNRATLIDPAGHRVDYLYDAWDRLRTTVLPGSPELERTRIELSLNYRDQVERLQITGRTTPGVTGVLLNALTDYDERGRPWRRRLDGIVTTFMYDADERVIRQTNARNNSTSFRWDGLNRIVRAIDPLGNTLVRRYDAAGNLVRSESHEVLPGGGIEVLTTAFSYDSRLRPISIQAPLGRVTQRVYDARGYVVGQVDPLGATVHRSYGVSGELLSATTQVTSVNTAAHLFTYDAAGRQIAYTDPDGAVTTYAYDERDRRTSITYPDGRVHRFRYDARRQIASELTPGGTVKRYVYGPDASLIQITFTPGVGVVPTPPISIAADGLRRVVQMRQGGVVLNRTHDASLRLLSESVNGSTASLTHDDATGTALLSYPDGRQDRLRFDELGRLAQITLVAPGVSGLTGTVPAGTVLARYAYRGPERMARRDLHIGVATEFDYDAAGRLTAVLHIDNVGRSLARMRYVYDAADRRRVSWATPLPNTPARFDYDRAGHLTAAALGLPLPEPGSNLDQPAADAIISAAAALVTPLNEKYGLEPSGIRSSVTRNSAAGTTSDAYTITAAYEIAQITRTGLGARIIPFTFNGDGQCVRDERYIYLHDAAGCLVEVHDLPGGNIVLKQAFDPAGRVLSRTENSVHYEQRYLGLRLLQRQDLNGSAIAQVTPGVGIDEVLLESTGTNRYPLQEASSSVLAYVDASGTVSERYQYSPFGEATIWAADGVTPRATTAIGGLARFGGYPLLSVGLYDARARVYEPRTGRFLQPDPMGYSDAADLYTYVHHDPIGYVDPTGEVAVLIGLAVAAGVGLLVGGGLNATRQLIQMHEGTRREFSFGELALSAGAGAVAGPLLVVAPELAVPLAAYGVYGGASELAEGHWETGTFDIATSLAPFGLKGVRAASFGEGSVFAPARGLGPSATAGARFARIPELGRATADSVGRAWNERFYHGTDELTAQGAVRDPQAHLATVRLIQQYPGTRHLGPGLYFTRTPGDPTIPGSASWWAQQGGGTGRGGNPAVLEASIPRWRVFILGREPGVQINVSQQNFPNAPQSFFPFDGPLNRPPAGPAADFTAAARWRMWDPNSPQPDLSGLLPTLATRSPRWPQDGTTSKSVK